MWTEETKGTINWTEESKGTISFTEETKTTISWEDKDKTTAITLTRSVMGDWTRAELATMIHGDASATVTRKDIEDYFKRKPTISWGEETKTTINWSES